MKKNKKKYNLGGAITNLFSNVANGGFKNVTPGDRGEKIGNTIGNVAGDLIPGFGPAGELLGNLFGKFGGMFDKEGANPMKSTGEATSNPYGQMKDGGLVKYNGSTHENGGIPIGKDMKPTNRKNAIAEVEDGETSYKDYVFSDTLGKDGKTFAKLSKKIENKYKGREDDLAKKTMNLELKKLMGSNEQERVKKEQATTFRYGGDTQASDESSGSSGIGDSSTPTPLYANTPNSILPPALSKVPEDMSLKKDSSNILNMFGGLGDLFGGNNNTQKYPTIGDSFKRREQITSAKIPSKSPQISNKPLGNISKPDDKLAINYNNQHFNDKLPVAKHGGKIKKYTDGGPPLEDITDPNAYINGLLGLNNESYSGVTLPNNTSKSAKKGTLIKGTPDSKNPRYYGYYNPSIDSDKNHMSNIPGIYTKTAENQSMQGLHPDNGYGSSFKKMLPNIMELGKPDVPSPIKNINTLTSTGIGSVKDSNKPTTSDTPKDEAFYRFGNSGGTKEEMNEWMKNNKITPKGKGSSKGEGNSTPAPSTPNTMETEGGNFLADMANKFNGDTSNPTQTDPSNKNNTKEGDENLSEEEKEAKKKGLHYLTPAIIGKGTELLGKGAILAKGYDKVDPNYNRYEGKVKDIMSKRGVDMDAVINQINLQRNSRLKSNQNARSLNVKRSLDNQAYQNASQQVAGTELQKQQMNNTYRGEEARQLDTLGQQRVQAKTYAEDAEAKNKGQYFTNMGTFLGDIGRAGAFGSKYLANDYKVKEMSTLLSNKYEDFGITEDMMERLNTGKLNNEEEMIIYKAAEKIKKQQEKTKKEE